MVTRASEMTEIGDCIEATDEENGGEKVKITMVQRIETKLYVVNQGANRKRGQEVLTVYSREELQHGEAQSKALSTGWGRPK